MDEAPWVTAALHGREGQKWQQSHCYAAAVMLGPPTQGPSSESRQEALSWPWGGGMGKEERSLLRWASKGPGSCGSEGCEGLVPAPAELGLKAERDPGVRALAPDPRALWDCTSFPVPPRGGTVSPRAWGKSSIILQRAGGLLNAHSVSLWIRGGIKGSERDLAFSGVKSLGKGAQRVTPPGREVLWPIIKRLLSGLRSANHFAV